MRISSVTALGVVLVLASLPAVAQESGEPAVERVRARTVEISPAEPGAAVVVDGRRYAGAVRIDGHGDGLAVVESVGLDDYLAGIQEVPFSWEPAALEAQVIAARTYLAWNLARGRTDSGRRYDYDICATDACQVYAGLEPRLAEGGRRWLRAVEATRGQVLLYQGEPVQAYYSSTSGGRTRTVGDVWPEVDLPYLVAVDSPGEDSPFVEWMWRLPQRHMQRLLEQAGLAEGRVTALSTTVTEDGGGPWRVAIESTGATREVDTWTLRGMLNRAGPAALPAHLPGVRPDGPRLPQTILSPSYRFATFRLPILAPGAPPVLTIYQVDGRGWGHLVGMSQYGAQAMAEAGAEPAQILAHYYGGLQPVEAPEWVPEEVEVALSLGRDDLDLEVTGPVRVTVDGEEVAAAELGSWSLVADGGSIEVTAPEGLGLPPRLRRGRLGLAGGRLVLRPELTAPAEVSWRLTRGTTVVASFGPAPHDAGFLTIPLPLDPDTSLEVIARNPHGTDRIVVGGG